MKLNRFLLAPVLLWFAFFLAVPLALVVVVSLLSKDAYGALLWAFSGESYLRVFEWVHFRILFESLKLATLTTVICLVIGVLISWAMATATSRWRQVFLLLVTLPFLTNLVIRVYAIRVFVGFEGPLQKSLNLFGIPFDPFSLTQNEPLVLYGMVTTYLPFMVLPLFSAFEKFDFAMVEAAQDLGASTWKILKDVIVPNLKRPMVNGSLLVFIPSLGEYLIPDLLGGAKTMLYGNLITHQFLRARDWPFGAALSVVMMLVLLTCVLMVVRRVEGRRG